MLPNEVPLVNAPSFQASNHATIKKKQILTFDICYKMAIPANSTLTPIELLSTQANNLGNIFFSLKVSFYGAVIFASGSTLCCGVTLNIAGY